MIIFKNSQLLARHLMQCKQNGNLVGFVPTMGALHEGHISLIEASKQQNTITVCSIFVNPTQFNDPSDLEKYPRPLQNDILLLEAASCDILFLPEVDDIYPHGIAKLANFQFDGIETLWEGAARKGHYDGVAQIVQLLLSVVAPNTIYLGQKDYQQYVIICKLVALLHLPIHVVACPIYRELHGLAMSSRNIRLSKEMRIKAGLIYQTLQFAKTLLPILALAEVESVCKKVINEIEHMQIDYFVFVDSTTLQPIVNYNEAMQAVLLTSVIVDGVRLLDNVLVNPIKAIE